MSPLPDEPARERARSSLEENLLVEAGAGTGKTALIVERIVNLVETGRELRSIVAITFTEKAAGELKLRLRQALEIRGTPRTRTALGEIERASITTIHAWCASLLRSHPAEAGIDPLFRVIEGEEERLLFERIWEAWLGRAFQSGSPLAEVAGATIDWWVRHLADLARFLVQVRARLPDAIPETIGGDPAAGLAELFGRTDFGAYAEGCLDPKDRVMAAIEKSAYARETFLALQPEERVAALYGQEPLPLVSYGRQGRRENWRGGTLAEARTALDELVRRWQEARAQAMHDLCVRMMRWLAVGPASFLSAYEAEKAKQGLLDFDDLLVRSARLLRTHPAVRRQLRRSVKHLLVDEFQDTDPVQAEAAFLVTALNDTIDWTEASPRPGALFLVGDPKQSIYGFRGADLGVYAAARRGIPSSGSVLEIRTNFRSHPRLIDWFNGVFEALMAGGSPHQAPWAPLAAPGSSGEEEPRVHVVRPPEGAEFPTAAASRDAEARTVAAFLRERALGRWSVRERSGAERPMRWGDLVVLLRNRTSSLTAWERAFRAAAIPYLVVGGRALWGRQEVRALAAVAAAVDDPLDEVAVVAALKSPFIGASDADLLRWKHQQGGFQAGEGTGVVGEALQRIRQWHRARLSTPPYRLLERILVETGALATFMLKPDGRQRVANLLLLIESARQGADTAGPGTSAPPSFRSFVRSLAGRVEELREEGEANVVEEGGDAVRIMTMHAAKGLEFPVVVLGDLAVGESRQDPHLLAVGGSLQIRMGAKEIGMETREFQEAREEQARREQAEEIRLLYVAATRARDNLIVPLFAPTGGRGPGFFYRTLTQAFPRFLEAGAGERLQEGEGGPAWIAPPIEPIGGDPPVFRLPAEEILSHLEQARSGQVAPWTPGDLAGRARALAAGSVTGVLPATPPPGQLRLDYRYSPEEARRLGTCVHGTLELFDLDDPQALGRGAAAAAKAAGLSEAVQLHASQLAQAAAGLPSIRRALASKRRLVEWPFVLPVPPTGFLLEGVVDLAWVEEGGLVVLDWKTDALGPGDEPVAQATEHHRHQLETYAWALSRLTGLPVVEAVLAFLSVGREVKWRIDPGILDQAAGRLSAACSADPTERS